MSSRLDKEKALGNLAELREKIYSNTDPALLIEYRKLFKKKFSFFRRSWAAAWLFMYYDQKETPKTGMGKKKKHTSTSKPAESDDSELALKEEESKRLFFNIGKNRRLYPREVIVLVISKTSAAREDIGLIRILDNYSFVQVRDTKAEEIIEKLNGLKFRGRNLVVNYAKAKSEETQT